MEAIIKNAPKDIVAAAKRAKKADKVRQELLLNLPAKLDKLSELKIEELEAGEILIRVLNQRPTDESGLLKFSTDTDDDYRRIAELISPVIKDKLVEANILVNIRPLSSYYLDYRPTKLAQESLLQEIQRQLKRRDALPSSPRHRLSPLTKPPS